MHLTLRHLHTIVTALCNEQPQRPLLLRYSLRPRDLRTISTLLANEANMPTHPSEYCWAKADTLAKFKTWRATKPPDWTLQFRRYDKRGTLL